jgi:alkylation response protein AidB-like acyl-CoA dehydrogenase
MAAATHTKPEAAIAPGGASFLLTPLGATPVFSPERFTDEQRAFYRTADQFTRTEVVPRAAQIEKKDNALLRTLLEKAGEAGLLSVGVPEAFGGLGQDETTGMLVAEAMVRMGSWSVTFGAHVGIGTLPIVYFGNDFQKMKYLPKLGTGKWVAAYALTEPGSGSDALGAKTTAKLSTDGKYYLLNGGKQFITNAGFADVFIVFAKIDGSAFTGFIVERTAPGLTVLPEEHKMGIRGSSTCGLSFEDCRVPAENLLGEIGKGHRIAFNILNIGRLKLGVGSVGGCKLALHAACTYAKERKQFQTALIDFGLMREKLARMATHTYALESMAYRTTGLVDQRLVASDLAAPHEHEKNLIDATEEFAVESSIIKVFGSEAVGMCTDEAIQIHGGYGYIEEYDVERGYRDARINRIFEGTNEINRMLITGMLLKRTMKGQLALLDFAGAANQELDVRSLPHAPSGPLGPQVRAAECIKRLAAYVLQVAVEAFGPDIEKHQEVLAAVADIVIEAYAMDTIVARTQHNPVDGELDPVRVAMCQLYGLGSYQRAYDRARSALCLSTQGDDLRRHLGRVSQLYEFLPYNTETLREQIVPSIVEHGGYPFAY